MKYSDLDMPNFCIHKSELLEESERIVRANIFFENLCNFECFNEKQHEDLLDNIFDLSYLLEGYSHCGCYDFDHISYALLGWCSEHEEQENWEFVGVLLNDCIEHKIDEDQLNMIWRIVERYNDIDADFEEGRFFNGN
ncbi:MAG: hypothetical protein J6J36_06615 [Clostridia bacterium]|nr:hypothetical protein [Clostridia bacterium]